METNYFQETNLLRGEVKKKGREGSEGSGPDHNYHPKPPCSTQSLVAHMLSMQESVIGQI